MKRAKAHWKRKVKAQAKNTLGSDDIEKNYDVQGIVKPVYFGLAPGTYGITRSNAWKYPRQIALLFWKHEIVRDPSMYLDEHYRSWVRKHFEWALGPEGKRILAIRD